MVYEIDLNTSDPLSLHLGTIYERCFRASGCRYPYFGPSFAMVFGMMLLPKMIASWLRDWWLWVPVLVGPGAAHPRCPIYMSWYGKLTIEKSMDMK